MGIEKNIANMYMEFDDPNLDMADRKIGDPVRWDDVLSRSRDDYKYLLVEMIEGGIREFYIDPCYMMEEAVIIKNPAYLMHNPHRKDNEFESIDAETMINRKDIKNIYEMIKV